MNKKLNVLHLISSLDVGGAEKLLIDLLKVNLANVEYTVVVMNDVINEKLKHELLNTSSKVYFLNRKQSHKHPKYFFQLQKIIKENKIDIIHSHNYGSKHWSILCKLFNPKIKLVQTVHDTKIISKLNKINLLLHKTFIDMNIAISIAVMQEVEKYGIVNVKKIYDGIELKKYMQRKDTNFDCFNIINIARITHNKKGQDILIKALKICKDKGLKFSCNFAGGVYDYDKESFEYLQDLTKKLELQEDINFLGNRNDIPELLSESDLFILPSRYEGLGLVILEAMISKVPVICSNIDGPAELINSGETGLLFESENYEDLVDKIQYLYENRNIINELVENAYKFVQDFDISIMAKNYYEVYRKLIK